MKVIKILIVAAVLIAAFSQLHAQPVVETLTVDTLCYLGKDVAGEAAGAFFMPDGNIIVLWKDSPVIIDSKTGQIIRSLEALPDQDIAYPALSKDGRYLIAYAIKGSAIWDVVTGKIVKFIPIANDYCFSPDGSKMYCTSTSLSETPGIIRVYDINTLEIIERFFTNGFYMGDRMAISPDGQTLALSVFKKNDDDKTTNQVILIDLKNKNNYTVIETLEPQVYSMEFSPDGKNLMYRYIGSYNSKVYIYNLDTKEKTYLNKSDLANLYNIKQPALYDSFFLNENTILIPISSGFDLNEYSFIWDITKKELKKIINFSTNTIDIKQNSLLLSSYFGALAILDLEYVSVKDNLLPNESFLKYFNNQLEFISDKAFNGEEMIYDTTGKLIAKLGSQQFVIGRNIIRINQNLPIGVYILTIKNQTHQNSYKFIVE